MIPKIITSSPAVGGVRSGGTPPLSNGPAILGQAPNAKPTKQAPLALVAIRQNATLEMCLQQGLDPTAVTESALTATEFDLALVSAHGFFRETSLDGQHPAVAKAASLLAHHIALREQATRYRNALYRG